MASDLLGRVPQPPLLLRLRKTWGYPREEKERRVQGCGQGAPEDAQGPGRQLARRAGGGLAGRGAARGSGAEGRGSRSAEPRVQKRRRGAARGGRAPGRARAPAAASSPRRPPPPAPRSPAPSTARAARRLLFAGGGRSPGLQKPAPHPRSQSAAAAVTAAAAAAAAEPGSSGRSGRCPQSAPGRVTAEAGRGACAGWAREGARARPGARSRGRRGGGRGRRAPPPVKGGSSASRAERTLLLPALGPRRRRGRSPGRWDPGHQQVPLLLPSKTSQIDSLLTSPMPTPESKPPSSGAWTSLI
ncbi:spidroin-2-like [Panthera pardus]|uniref:Spidroin-2-like n=1 Tax=Panthera pardus TaxID=9691 RepID=A0A9W2V9S5_PANPR|nr:spidroin-2-like [Panthera pardus]